MTTICFTGHRPSALCGYDHDKYVEFVDDLSRRLSKFCDGEPVKFITGGAQGFDQLAFWAIDKIRRDLPPEKAKNIENIVYVPFPGQSSIWRQKGLFGKEEYDLMLKRATDIRYCTAEKPATKRGITAALMDRNHQMVDSSDIVIALCGHDNWNDPATSGGTAACMRYAAAQNKTIYRLKCRLNDSNPLRIEEVIKYDSPNNETLSGESMNFKYGF